MPSAATEAAASAGRAAAVARRRALSAGKAALPAAAERVRNGQRSAALPAPTTPSRAPVHAESAPTATSMTPAPSALVPAAPPAANAIASGSAASGSAASGSAASGSFAGRLLSMLRRRQMSAGKQALPAGAPVTSGSKPSSLLAQQAPASQPASASLPLPAMGASETSCRDQARARRATLSQRGRGDAPAAPPSRVPRLGTIDTAPKVVSSPTHGGQRVTGLRIGRGAQVTGDEPGAALPVSGTQYIGADGGAAVRPAGPKVGLARTPGGYVVSGTLVRSSVAVTGDEAGGAITITGEADQRTQDDVTPRSGERAVAVAQFQRQVDPHGHSVFGANLGRSARRVGSRERDPRSLAAALETTDGGLPITGNPIGRSVRVTGDEPGACRHVTGDQYLTPAQRQAECGGLGGGSAPAAQVRAVRRDPASGAKVSEARTFNGQRVTGSDMEHNPRVTGAAAGACATITGTPYQGATTVQGWCDPATADTAVQRLQRARALATVTGDTPAHDAQVTGTARGAAREITGTPYNGAAGDPDQQAVEPHTLARLDSRFSIGSPQRTAHLRASAAADQDPDAAAPGTTARVTGSFALGLDKVTGNAEFLFRPRRSADPDAVAAHARLTGEGRTTGPRVSGCAWSAHANVTGTEGTTAAQRNPSERAGKPHAFAGAARLKAPGKHDEPRQNVTGMVGWSSSSAAKVTLSGGAHG